jgi:hypothetical protein
MRNLRRERLWVAQDALVRISVRKRTSYFRSQSNCSDRIREPEGQRGSNFAIMTAVYYSHINRFSTSRASSVPVQRPTKRSAPLRIPTIGTDEESRPRHSLVWGNCETANRCSSIVMAHLRLICQLRWLFQHGSDAFVNHLGKQRRSCHAHFRGSRLLTEVTERFTLRSFRYDCSNGTAFFDRREETSSPRWGRVGRFGFLRGSDSSARDVRFLCLPKNKTMSKYDFATIKQSTFPNWVISRYICI